MKPVSLTVYPRTETGRNSVKHLRAQSRIPAVIYGDNVENQNLELPTKVMEQLIHHSFSEIILIDMEIDGDARAKRLALVKQVQHHPLNRDILHVDFQEVSEDKKVAVSVPIETKGEPVGVKTGGGTLEHVLFNVRVQGLPLQLPEVIYLDVSDLDISHALTIGDIPIPEGIEILGDKSIPVATVKPPRVSEDEETGAEEAAEEAQPTEEAQQENAE